MSHKHITYFKLVQQNITYVVSLYPTPETLFFVRKQGNLILPGLPTN